MKRSISFKLPIAFRHYSNSTLSQPSRAGSNPAMAFPCLDKLENRSQSYESGPEPDYSRVVSGYETYKSTKPLHLDFGGVLPSFDLAYETWGNLNSDASNAILLHTGLSASSHARSHSKNPSPGWWEKFIGPGLSIDTNRWFVICTNVLGGCYGSTGPSSIDPADGERYATRFPIISINDMVRAQNRLIKDLGISKLYASVGASMGGMQSLAYAREFPESIAKLVSISGCARSHPYSIAMRYTQRQILMSDPNWQRGFYYTKGIPPHVGMKLAREVATVTYRSGPEWERRFGRKRADESKSPALCPDFLIETYLDHQGEKFCTEYDANSLLYVSKAMDLFDMGYNLQKKTESIRKGEIHLDNEGCALPDRPYTEKVNAQPKQEQNDDEKDADLLRGMKPLAGIPTFVLGVETDFLFPSFQQREIYTALKEINVKKGFSDASVKYIELGPDVSIFGHDTFLLNVKHVGQPLKEFLEK